MHKKVNYKCPIKKDNEILADVLSCEKRDQYFRIKYEIYFYQGLYSGKTEIIFADLEDIECDDLAGFLIEEGYLKEYSLGEDYFEVKSREIFIATRKDNFCEI